MIGKVLLRQLFFHYNVDLSQTLMLEKWVLVLNNTIYCELLSIKERIHV